MIKELVEICNEIVNLGGLEWSSPLNIYQVEIGVGFLLLYFISNKQ